MHETALPIDPTGRDFRTIKTLDELDAVIEGSTVPASLSFRGSIDGHPSALVTGAAVGKVSIDQPATTGIGVEDERSSRHFSECRVLGQVDEPQMEEGSG